MKVWKTRKTTWANGYYIIVSELVEELYDWELDPMCDCTPAQKVYFPTGKWAVDVSKVYITERFYTVNNVVKVAYTAHTCYDPCAKVSNITHEEAINIYMNLTTKKIPVTTIKEHFDALANA